MDAREINWDLGQFHPVITLPGEYEIYDFSETYDPQRKLTHIFGVGKFNELRPDMYQGELYQDRRNIHMGIDIGAPVGTPVYSFADGEIFLFANNDKPFDYGHTIITRHWIEGVQVFALYGHLSMQSIQRLQVSQKIEKGQLIAWVGDKHENGGWNPHLHFQVSLVEPKVADMPGVVTAAERDSALAQFVDPRKILGPLY